MTARLLPDPPPKHAFVYAHFARRVRERVDAEIDPLDHWWRIVVAIDKGDSETLTFLGRLNRRGRRLWRYALPDGRKFLVIFDHDIDAPITIFGDEKIQRCGSRGQKRIIDGVPYVF